MLYGNIYLLAYVKKQSVKYKRKQKIKVNYRSNRFRSRILFSLLFHASGATKHNQKVFISATHRRVPDCAGPNRTGPPDSGSGSKYTRAGRIRLIEKVKSAISQNRFDFFFVFSSNAASLRFDFYRLLVAVIFNLFANTSRYKPIIYSLNLHTSNTTLFKFNTAQNVFMKYNFFFKTFLSTFNQKKYIRIYKTRIKDKNR